MLALVWAWWAPIAAEEGPVDQLLARVDKPPDRDEWLADLRLGGDEARRAAIALLPKASEIGPELLALLESGCCDAPTACVIAPLVAGALPGVREELVRLFDSRPGLLAALVASPPADAFREFHPLLCSKLSNAQNELERTRLWGALSVAGATDNGTLHLTAMLDSGDPDVRREALGWLARLPRGSWAAGVLALLGAASEDEERLAALNVLTDTPLPAGVELQVVRRIAQMTDSRLRLHEPAMAILARHSASEREWLLQQASHSPDSDLAWSAVEALADLRPEIVSDVCVGALERSSAFRLLAVRILERAQGPVSLDLLVRLVDRSSGDDLTQVAAARAMPSILERVSATLPTSWPEWLLNLSRQDHADDVALALDAVPRGSPINGEHSTLIESWLTAGHSGVRRAVASGLGRWHISDKHIEERWLNRLLDDREIDVRLSAMRSLLQLRARARFDEARARTLSEGLVHASTPVRAIALDILLLLESRGGPWVGQIQPEPPGSYMWILATRARVSVSADSQGAIRTVFQFLIAHQRQWDRIALALPWIGTLLVELRDESKIYVPVVEALQRATRCLRCYELYGNLLVQLRG